MPVVKLWSQFDVQPCPPPLVHTGGVYRTPVYMTLATAFHCMDKNGDGKLSVTELGPGATVSGATYDQFYEAVRRHRYSMLLGLDSALVTQIAGVRAIAEGIMARIPRGTATPVKRQAMVSPLPSRVEVANTGSRGVVAELYTFGSPAITLGKPLINSARADGCFPGLRVYRRGSAEFPDFMIRLDVADPVPWLLKAFGFVHPQSSVLSMYEDEPLKSGYSSCADLWDGPQVDLLWWWKGHEDTDYARQLAELANLVGEEIHETRQEREQAFAMPEDTDDDDLYDSICSEHEACAMLGLAAANPYAECCPAPNGTMLGCCTSATANDIDKFSARMPYTLGDYVRVKSSEEEVKAEFVQVMYEWDDGMAPMLGQVFPIIKVPSPSIVALPSAGGANGGQWYFPTSAVEPVPEEVAAEYRGPTKPPLVLTNGPLQQERQNFEGYKEFLGKKITTIRKASEHQALAAAGFRFDPIVIFMDAQGLGWTMVGHGRESSYSNKYNVYMTMFQKPHTKECVLNFAAHMSKQFQEESELAQAMATGSQNNLLQRVFLWFAFMAGVHPSNIPSYGPGGWNHQEFKNSEETQENPDKDCFVRRFGGMKPCRTKEQALNLTGISTVNEVLDFCGAPGVQHKFAAYARALFQSDAYLKDIRPKLESCASVSATGFDVGGVLASLWTMCANSGLSEGEDGFDDFSIVTWTPLKEPQTLPPFKPTWGNPEFFLLRNRKTGKILMLTGKDDDLVDGAGDLVLSWGNSPGCSQRWAFTPDGFLQNENDGRCLGVEGFLGASTDPASGIGKNVDFGECEFGVKATDQAWNLSASGDLVNQYTSLCLSAEMKLAACPMSDQIWHLRSDGFIVHQRTGYCMDVEGDPGTKNGAGVILYECEFDKPDTDQKWEVTAGGLLMNLKSKKCLDVKNVNAILIPARLVIWDCVQTLERAVAQEWYFTPDGFIQNRLVGRCVDLYGYYGSLLKSPLVLWTCEKFHAQPSPNLWQLTPLGQIVNRGGDRQYRGRCVAQEDDTLIMEACETRARQLWRTTKSGRIRPALGLGACLGDRDGKLAVRPCVGNVTLAEEWQLTPEGFLMNDLTAKCIDVAEDGLTVQENYCHMTDQKWVKAGRLLKNVLAGKCMDERGGDASAAQSGTPVELWNCEGIEGNSTQSWIIEPLGQVRNGFSGKCLDIGGDKAADDAPLVAATCNPAALSQRWYLSSSGYIKSFLDRRCVNVKGKAAHASGDPLVLSKCQFGSNYTDQTWELLGRGGTVVSAEQALKLTNTIAKPVLAPASEKEQAAKDLELLVRGGPSAGTFEAFNGNTYWLYRGYAHWVPPTLDCSACFCRRNIIALAPTAGEALVMGKYFDCHLQHVANELDGFAQESESLDTEAADDLPEVGRFVSAGAQVYWEFQQHKHLVPPGVGCDRCGCKDRVVAVSEIELDGLIAGMEFKCALKALASYGADFTRA